MCKGVNEPLLCVKLEQARSQLHVTWGWGWGVGRGGGGIHFLGMAGTSGV